MDVDYPILVSRYKCVIVMCDQQWLDPDLDARNGIMMAKQKDMLRLDSMIMMVQLNVRDLLEVSQKWIFLYNNLTPSCLIDCTISEIKFRG